jgi:hypothetical protein
MTVFMNKENFRLLVVGTIAFLMSLLPPIAAQATLGWEVGDMVLDFGLGLEPGEQVVLIDKYEVGHPFFVELIWKLNSEHCAVQIQESSGQGDIVLTKALHDDGLFNGVVFHAVYPEVEAVIVRAAEGKQCEIDPSQNEFLVIARKPRAPVSVEEGMSPAPLGAVVMVFRATTFFLPRDVIVKPGEKVV